MSSTAIAPNASRWQRFVAATVRAFHSYAGWLVSITWWRFILLAILLLIVSGILQHVPPFSWKTTEVLAIDETKTKPPKPPKPPNGADKDT